MIHRLRESRWFYILLSILLAVMFWLYVREVQNPTLETTFYGIQLQFTGARVLEERGLTVSSVNPTEVKVKVNAPNSVMSNLNRENITAVVDLSECTQPGQYELSYTPKLPTNIDTTNAFFTNQEPQTVTVTIDNLATETKTVEVQLEGNVADGYQAGTPVIDPETVEISGTAEQISKVSRVVVVVEAEDLNETYSGRLPLTMLDAQGNPITDSTIQMSEDTAYVTLPVGVVKEVPLTVTFLPGGGVTDIEANVEYSIEPSTITVIGSKEELAGLTEISLGSIDLSTVMGTSTITMPIKLSSTLENAVGVTEATVTVTVKGLATKTFNVTNITLINEPSGYNVTLVTKERQVMVRGSQSVLDTLDASQIRITADVSNVTATGTSTVRAKAYLDSGGDEVGIVGTYDVTVNVTR